VCEVITESVSTSGIKALESAKNNKKAEKCKKKSTARIPKIQTF
jgi:hypothetical protein